MKKFFNKGITALELLVVIAVLGVIFAIIIPQFSKNRELQVLKSGVQDIISSAEKAHGQTLASLDSSSYGVHFQSDKVIIFKGTSFVLNDANNETINITTPAVISSGTLTLPVNIYFSRLSGTPSSTGTLNISTANYSKVITISATGNVSVN